jgi:glycosyltransferase involved in cell wall biosynthesis
MPAAVHAPTVSVVIPTYNHRAYVLQTLDSVFAQTYADYEIIVVNDGSPDDTAELLRPLVEAGRIRYIEQPNAGMGAARNRGIAEARGRYIAVLDDDDLWPPDKLAWQVEALENRPHAVLAYGRSALIKPDGSIYVHEYPDFPSGEVYTQMLEKSWLISPGMALMRADTMRRLGGFDPKIWGADDWDLYIRLAREGEFVFEDRVSLFYRMHPENASRRHVIRLANNFFRTVHKHAGWNVRLMSRQLRFGLPIYNEPLHQLTQRCWETGDYRGAAHAWLYRMLFASSPLLIHALHPHRVPSRMATSVTKRLRRGEVRAR